MVTINICGKQIFVPNVRYVIHPQTYRHESTENDTYLRFVAFQGYVTDKTRLVSVLLRLENIIQTVYVFIHTPKILNKNINNHSVSEKQTADAANNYVLNDDVLDELQNFKHAQSTNISATCTYNTCDKDIHIRGLES
jgi:hypothetical protein